MTDTLAGENFGEQQAKLGLAKKKTLINLSPASSFFQMQQAIGR